MSVIALILIDVPHAPEPNTPTDTPGISMRRSAYFLRWRMFSGTSAFSIEANPAAQDIYADGVQA
jgi:hypothetical protein